MTYTTRSTCRICGNRDLIPILSLGTHYVSNFVDFVDHSCSRAPLELVLCNRETAGCGLLQLKHTVDRDLLYRRYWYYSNVNMQMRNHLAGIAHTVEASVHLKEGNIVVDIGCNTGELLASYKTAGIKTVGFEPARNLVSYAEKTAWKIVNDYFTYDAFNSNAPGKARVITSIAMFYDLDEPNTFVADIKNALEPDGIWINEMSYLPSILKRNGFDSVVHEHLEFYSLTVFRELLAKHGLEVFKVEFNDINGGSFRTYVCHRELQRSPSGTPYVDEVVKAEAQLSLIRPYTIFAAEVRRIKHQLHGFLQKQHRAGRIVMGYGASTKGNTLLQYCGLDSGLVKAIADRNPDKWGRLTVGSWIPICSEEEMRRAKPDYLLVLPWAFIDGFIQREKDYLEQGGKLIVPLPKFNIIDKNAFIRSSSR